MPKGKGAKRTAACPSCGSRFKLVGQGARERCQAALSLKPCDRDNPRAYRETPMKFLCAPQHLAEGQSRGFLLDGRNLLAVRREAIIEKGGAPATRARATKKKASTKKAAPKASTPRKAAAKAIEGQIERTPPGEIRMPCFFNSFDTRS